jgi:hypothetical protein
VYFSCLQFFDKKMKRINKDRFLQACLFPLLTDLIRGGGTNGQAGKRAQSAGGGRDLDKYST